LRPKLSALLVFWRQPQIERRSVNPPVAADLESRKIAAPDQSINGRRVHAQHFGYLVDGKNSLEFRLIRPGPFHQLTTSHVVIQIHSHPPMRVGFTHPSDVVIRISPNSRNSAPGTSDLSQIFGGTDVRPHVQCGICS